MNIKKRVEIEAPFMDVRTLQAGAEVLLSGIRNAVRLVKLIIEQTDHILARVYITADRKEPVASLTAKVVK